MCALPQRSSLGCPSPPAPQGPCPAPHHFLLMGSSSLQSPALQPWLCRAEKGQILSPATASLCSGGFSEAAKKPLSALGKSHEANTACWATTGAHLALDVFGCELPRQKREVCYGVAEFQAGMAPPAWLLGCG